MSQSDFRSHRALSLAFAMSFCSFGYQQTLALTLADSSGDFVLSQALALAAFLLGLGAGSALGDRGPRPSWRGLFYIESAQALIGALSVAAVQAAELGAHYFFPGHAAALLFVPALPVVGLLGLVNGLEIPVLLRLHPGISAARILGASYFGALIASAVVPVLLIPTLDVSATALVLGLVNLLLGVTLLPALTGQAWSAALIALVALLGWWRVQPVWSAFHLRQIYWRPAFQGLRAVVNDFRLMDRLAVPQRHRTAYQWIDIVPRDFAARVQGPNPYLLFLNRNLQFSADSFKRYHQSMVHGAVDLLRREPGRVLILGGGDGLLLPELLKYHSVQTIDLVELDPAMLDLARHDPELLLLNQDSVADPRVKTHVEDAFQFVRAPHPPYDLILIDLPYPRSYELSPLFSREFYTFVRARLAGDGLMAMDFPPPERGRRAFAVVLHSLRAAGFKGLTAFGDEEVFVVARHEPGPRDFRFKELNRRVDDQTVLNLFSRRTDVDAALATPAPVNSVLFPLRFDRLDNGAPRALGLARGDAGARRPRPFHDNPGLLAIFLERFRRFQQTHFMEPAWPREMTRYWEHALQEPRDLEEPISPDWMWPRFSWLREFEAGAARGPATLLWVDMKTPERLRAAWRAAFKRAPAGDWRAVAWRPGSGAGEAVFYFMDTPSVWRGRRLNGEVDERIVFHPDGRNFEILHGGRVLWRGEAARMLMYENYQTPLARTQFDLKRDFFLLPRHYADNVDHTKRILYYP